MDLTDSMQRVVEFPSKCVWSLNEHLPELTAVLCIAFFSACIAPPSSEIPSITAVLLTISNALPPISP